MSLGSVNMILGLPWLKKFNPNIDWVTGTLDIDPSKFRRTLSSATKAFRGKQEHLKERMHHIIQKTRENHASTPVDTPEWRTPNPIRHILQVIAQKYWQSRMNTLALTPEPTPAHDTPISRKEHTCSITWKHRQDPSTLTPARPASKHMCCIVRKTRPIYECC